MIQRIQSLYLLLATAAYVCLFFLPFASFLSNGINYKLSILGVSADGGPPQGSIFLLAGVILLIILTVSIIFMYKKRMLQNRLTAISLLLNLGLIAGMFFYSDHVAKDATVNFEVGSYIVLVPLVFLVLAIRAIRRDEMKIKAADRLR